MLRTLKNLENFTIGATDGEIGSVKDFYFKDDTWVVRYLVVETGSWLVNRKVLVSPISVKHLDWSGHTLAVSISREQVKNSPAFDSQKPVSLQNEELYMGHYGYSNYWGGGGLWGAGLYPYAVAPGFDPYSVDPAERERETHAYMRSERVRRQNEDPHLRSCNFVTGHHIRATDGEIGHVSGFLIDDETWEIRYLIVDTSNWWVGHKVLVAPIWVKEVNWSSQTVAVDLGREAIKTAPAYDPSADLSHEHEMALFRHYGYKGDWPVNRGSKPNPDV